MNNLVLSLFPGIGLLDRAFEEEGFCVVRGPDVIWGGDVRRFHPPVGVFAGVIGGPPCQMFSALAHLIRHNGHEPSFGNLIPEFERVVGEAMPEWFIMENVPAAPMPSVTGYITREQIVKDCWVGGCQPRARRISFGTADGRILPIDWQIFAEPTEMVSVISSDSGIAYEEKRRKRSITGDARQVSTGSRLRKEHHKEGGGVMPHMGSVLPIEDACEAQGLPRDFTDHMPFTTQGKRKAIGNGVPLPMGRAVAKAVKRAVEKLDSPSAD